MDQSLIVQGVRELPEPDVEPHVRFNEAGKPTLVVTEQGTPRELSISKKVAEVLIAAGFGYEG